MSTGSNWHNVAGTMFPESWGNMLTLPGSRAGNVGWFGAGANNTGTLFVGFSPSVTIPVNGVASATDGWPVAAGQALPFLTGEGEDLSSGPYVVSNTNTQDFYVIGYAPNQGADVVNLQTTLTLEDGLTGLVLEDGMDQLALEG